MPRQKTTDCVICHIRAPDKGRVCEHCRYLRRKDYFRIYSHKYHRTHGRNKRPDRDRQRALKEYVEFCSKC